MNRRRKEKKKNKKKKKKKVEQEIEMCVCVEGNLCRYHTAIKIVTSPLLEVEHISLLIHICPNRLVCYFHLGHR